MSSREDILASIRKNVRIRYDKPDLSALRASAISYPDKIEQFIVETEAVGGRAVVVEPDTDINALVRELYPEARRIATAVDEVRCGDSVRQITCATYHPDDVSCSAELDGTDLAIIEGQFGVCENAAVWIRQDVEERGVYFISEALVIILHKDTLVNNMHEAYERIDTGDKGYGVFISGPSKTADIEQALVMGAQGAHYLTVLLV